MNKFVILSWVIAIIAFLGSMFFSEMLAFVPCTLCWYQRILMYPLVILLGVGVYTNDPKVYRYVLPFSIIGMLVAAYHYAHQKIPFLSQFETCTSGVPCSGEYINWLGFITIPLLSLVAFTMITVFMVLSLKKQSV